MNASDYLLSVIRTAVPAGWGALAAWLLSLGIDVGETANTAAVTFLTGLAIAAYYALIRLIEPKLPAWLRVILIGAARKPAYSATPAPAYQNTPGRPGRGAW